ncbi:MAG: sigma 54-dependent Fis family transcriptional regulator [Myxococcales bacterium]|nr:sigma 54-dependent Fis family transcriptional regulator [Myxococcales bacterium]
MVRTEEVRGAGRDRIELRHARVRVVSGPNAGAACDAVDGRITIGTAEGNLLVLTDSTVSRFHCELELGADGVVVRDLGSRNGTLLHGVHVRDALVRKSVELDLGRTKIRLELGDEMVSVELSSSRSFGALIGSSPAMRAVYASLSRAAPTSAPVLITGESGTGKELAARAVHDHSPRAKAPFEIVDCGGLPPTLAESELFGHDRGSFTGASGDRAGAFERADGGTLFLDELGELPLELQPKFLRALGEGEVRRVGSGKVRKVNVRVIAATNRDLRREINDGRFRADLFYRLAVIQVRMPPLRERLDDLPVLASSLLDRVAKERGVDTSMALDEALFATFARHRWPGNVRELRNYLEQWAVLRTQPSLTQTGAHNARETVGALSGESAGFDGLENMPLRAAKTALLERFERHYLTLLLEHTRGNVAEAARRAGVDRATLFRAIRRYDLRRDDEADVGE